MAYFIVLKSGKHVASLLLTFTSYSSICCQHVTVCDCQSKSFLYSVLFRLRAVNLKSWRVKILILSRSRHSQLAAVRNAIEQFSRPFPHATAYQNTSCVGCNLYSVVIRSMYVPGTRPIAALSHPSDCFSSRRSSYLTSLYRLKLQLHLISHAEGLRSSRSALNGCERSVASYVNLTCGLNRAPYGGKLSHPAAATDLAWTDSAEEEIGPAAQATLAQLDWALVCSQVGKSAWALLVDVHQSCNTHLPALACTSLFAVIPHSSTSCTIPDPF